jgi:hypothetical protein
MARGRALGWTLSFESALVWTTFVPTSLISVISAILGRRPGVAMSGLSIGVELCHYWSAPLRVDRLSDWI